MSKLDPSDNPLLCVNGGPAKCRVTCEECAGIRKSKNFREDWERLTGGKPVIISDGTVKLFTESQKDEFALKFADWLFHEGMLYKPVNISCKQLIEQFKQTLK